MEVVIISLAHILKSVFLTLLKIFVSFHKSCKYDCLLNKAVCNDKQKWNNKECRCDCLKIEECDNIFFWNVVNCRCEHKKVAKLISEECEEIVDDILNNKTVSITKM